MKSHLLFIALFLTQFFCLAQTQQNCDNIDFENGNFDLWQGFTGTAGGSINDIGLVNERHTIMSAFDFDYFSGGNISRLNPFGGQYSVRLGNQSVGGQAEKLRRVIQVTDEINSLIYFFSVVFQDPQHSPDQQPKFRIQVFDQFNQPLTDPCFNYSVTATSNIPGYQQSPIEAQVWFRPWTAVALDLSEFIGEQVTIEFTTEDCTLGGHFGYAYLDVICSKMQIYRSTCEDNIVSMWLPEGYTTYNWSTGDTTSWIQVTNPVVGTEYSVTAVTESGCESTFNYVYSGTEEPVFPPDLQFNYCSSGDAVVLSAPPGFTSYIWDNGDTTQFTTFLNITSGDTLSVTLSGGYYCDTTLSFVVGDIEVIETTPIIQNITYCVTDTIVEANLTGNYNSFLWYDGSDGSTWVSQLPLTTNPVTAYAYPNSGCPTLFSFNYIEEDPA